MNRDGQRTIADAAAHRLRAEMAARRITPEKLATRLPWDRERLKRVRRHLSGATRIHLDDVVDYARALHVSPAALAFGETP